MGRGRICARHASAAWEQEMCCTAKCRRAIGVAAQHVGVNLATPHSASRVHMAWTRAMLRAVFYKRKVARADHSAPCTTFLRHGATGWPFTVSVSVPPRVARLAEASSASRATAAGVVRPREANGGKPPTAKKAKRGSERPRPVKKVAGRRLPAGHRLHQRVSRMARPPLPLVR